MVVVEEAVFLEVVNVKVAVFSIAVVKVAPILEGVVVEVAVLSTAVVKVTILEDCCVKSIEG